MTCTPERYQEAWTHFRQVSEDERVVATASEMAERWLRIFHPSPIPVGALFLDQDGTTYVAVDPASHFSRTGEPVLWRITDKPVWATKTYWENSEGRVLSPISRLTLTLEDVYRQRGSGVEYMLVQSFIEY